MINISLNNDPQGRDEQRVWIRPWAPQTVRSLQASGPESNLSFGNAMSDNKVSLSFMGRRVEFTGN